MWQSWSNSINSYDSLLNWWDFTKYKIKQLTIETSRTIYTSKNSVNKYESRLNIKDSNNENDKNEIVILKEKINDYYSKQLDAVKIRSRVQYYEEGEKSTRYFYNLERKNISNKMWSKIKCNDGSFKTDINSILNKSAAGIT